MVHNLTKIQLNPAVKDFTGSQIVLLPAACASIETVRSSSRISHILMKISITLFFSLQAFSLQRIPANNLWLRAAALPRAACKLSTVADVYKPTFNNVDPIRNFVAFYDSVSFWSSFQTFSNAATCSSLASSAAAWSVSYSALELATFLQVFSNYPKAPTLSVAQIIILHTPYSLPLVQLAHLHASQDRPLASPLRKHCPSI